MTKQWSPDSWRLKPQAQPIEYPDAQALEQAVECLARLPPLVTSGEIEKLKGLLADAAAGERFVLQGGDCHESFSDCSAEPIAAKLKILLKMSLILAYGAQQAVVRIGRMAGQYAKPRTHAFETRGDTTLPTYRGDLINHPGFTVAERKPDPQLLLRGYERAALTLNFLRALIQGGLADFRHPEFWELGFVDLSKQSADLRELMRSIAESVRFLEAVAGRSLMEWLSRGELYVSHEGLNLWYEQAHTRQVPRRTGWYNLGTHFPWIGERTRAVDGAHVEYFRGIANPIGVKVSDRCSPDELLDLCDILNPDNIPGRLTIIHRFGAERIAASLPRLIDTVLRKGRRVVWICDPMHGNTATTSSGIKTRDFDAVLRELETSFDIHQAMGSVSAGVHFEMTGENVTECIGGARGLTEADLTRNYRSDVDPRLNYEQAMEMAMLLARKIRKNRLRDERNGRALS